MDYELFILSRVTDQMHKGVPTREAIALGLQRSGRIISSAALIIIVVFAGFATGQLMVIKALGVALAAAVFLDATIVRCLLVPAPHDLAGAGHVVGALLGEAPARPVRASRTVIERSRDQNSASSNSSGELGSSSTQRSSSARRVCQAAYAMPARATTPMPMRMYSPGPNDGFGFTTPSLVPTSVPNLLAPRIASRT